MWRGVFVKSTTWLLSPTPVPLGPPLAPPASVFMGKQMRWEGRAGGDSGCAGGCRLRLCLPAFLSAAAVSGWLAAAPAVAAGRAGSRCGASGGGLHADGQMDNETEWMRATHTLPPFSVVCTQKPRQRSSGSAGHSHTAHTCWRQRNGVGIEAAPPPPRNQEGGWGSAYDLKQDLLVSKP